MVVFNLLARNVVKLFLYKPHTIVVDNGNIWGWIPFNETFQVILVRGDVCKLKISNGGVVARTKHVKDDGSTAKQEEVEPQLSIAHLCPWFSVSRIE